MEQIGAFRRVVESTQMKVGLESNERNNRRKIHMYRYTYAYWYAYHMYAYRRLGYFVHCT